MKLYEGQKGSTLQVVRMDLPVQTERRLEVLGMLEGTKILVVNRKKRGAMRSEERCVGKECRV